MDEVELSHTGGSEVHLTGYRVEQMMGGSEDEDGYGLGGCCRSWAGWADGAASTGRGGLMCWCRHWVQQG